MGSEKVYSPVIRELKTSGFVKIDDWASSKGYEGSLLILADLILAERSTLFVGGWMPHSPGCSPNRGFNMWMQQLASHHPNTIACHSWLEHGTKDCLF